MNEINFVTFVILLFFKVNEIEGKNVLLLLADDGGFEMRTYGNKIVQTPNLDGLAKKSLIFNNAYTSVSSCSPSRSAILTGIPAHENGMYGLHHGVHHFNSLEKIKSLPQILAKNGIQTGIIGKKHVGPKQIYPFNFEFTEENSSILQVGRNITFIKLLTQQFLEKYKSNFFLMVSFHDPHRCGHSHPEYGNFCEKFGNGEKGMGSIPDWKPITYQPDQVEIPFFIPDSPKAREDVASQYTTISRLDQGIGLVLKELEKAGVANDTLIIYTSDNAIPFPSGRTNLYDSGLGVPFFLSSPYENSRKNEVTYYSTSLLDVTPTVLDWFNIQTKHNSSNHFKYTGKSLLPLLKKEPVVTDRPIFASHSLHEVTMYYPMRAVRTHKHKLIRNLNYKMPFPIDQDFYISPTFQELMNNTLHGLPTYWYKSLKEYYYRPQWELYDLLKDSEEKENVSSNPQYKDVFLELQSTLEEWLKKTNDPWICGLGGILEKNECFSLSNGLDS